MTKAKANKATPFSSDQAAELQQAVQATSELSFQEHMQSNILVVQELINNISDDRRPWVAGQAGNSLLFRAASSFLYYSAAPIRRSASLNEAISLRNCAMGCFPSDEAFEAQAAKIFEAFKPSAPVTEKDGNKAPRPAFLVAREAEVAKAIAEEIEILQENLPKLQGFLNGARYDYTMIQPSEFMGDRAAMATAKALEAIQSRVDQDLLHISKKWVTAEEAGNKKQMEYWNGEGFFAQQDYDIVVLGIKQSGFTIDS